MSDEPALAPEQSEPVETTYRVTAPGKVFGVEPGETFTKTLDPVQEARLLASGAIEKVGGKKAGTGTKADPPASPSGSTKKKE